MESSNSTPRVSRTEYWSRQKLGEPLFPDILWTAPENKQQAGKLLIIGGNEHAFAKVAEAYQVALQTGAGQVRVVMPEALRKTVGGVLPDCEYAPSTPSGSFSVKSLDVFLQYAQWADGILLPGDLGRNSETAIVLEKLLTKTAQPLTLTRDAADYFRDRPLDVLQHPNTTLVLSYADLQKLTMNAHFSEAFTFEMDFLHVIDALHALSLRYQAQLITLRQTQLFVAAGGRVTSTQLETEPKSWRAVTAARAAVIAMQHPSKHFEALTTAVNK